MEIKSKFLCSKGVALAFAMLLGGSPGVLLYANDSVEESLMVAQAGRTIKGLVTDANGEPLIGCNVVVVGSNAGVITDIDGRFALNVPADAKQIRITYIGYADQIVNLNGRSDFKVVLKEDNNALDEVVVVGYGTQKKSDVDRGGRTKLVARYWKVVPLPMSVLLCKELLRDWWSLVLLHVRVMKD